MHLESLTITNYRKFGTENNKIEFVHASPLHASQTHIAQSSTLIIGKNNTGKTTITNALSFLTSSNSTRLKSTDFNVSYLKDVVKEYLAFYETKETTCEDEERIEPTPPQLEFKIEVIISKNDEDDYLTHIAPFVPISAKSDKDITVNIVIRYQVKDTQKFNKNFLEKLSVLKSATKEGDQRSTKINLEYQQFEELCKLIDHDATDFQRTYYNKKKRFLISH